MSRLPLEPHQLQALIERAHCARSQYLADQRRRALAWVRALIRRRFEDRVSPPPVGVKSTPSPIP